jgi:transcriptional regulator with XRE-family HTH domain
MHDTSTPPEIGPGLQAARKAKRLTLEQLAQMSGVSRSMLSQIERGEANPTFAVLWNLTQALGIDFSALLAGSSVLHKPAIGVMSAEQTPEIVSGNGACRLRILSPMQTAGESEWYALEIASGGTLASAPHQAGAVEHFTALSGTFSVRSGGEERSVMAGETARYAADVDHAIANVSDQVGHGILVLLYR